jgi:hypothetical protein
MTMTLTPAQLGQLIMDGDPYTSSGNPVAATEPVEVQADLGTWQFKGTPYYIEKAIKIPYTYKDINGHLIQDFILIGYAGGGAY